MEMPALPIVLVHADSHASHCHAFQVRPLTPMVSPLAARPEDIAAAAELRHTLRHEPLRRHCIAAAISCRHYYCHC